MLDQKNIDARRESVVPPQQHFIAGKWVSGEEDARMDVISPIDGKCFSSLADGGACDVDRAVAAARAVFEKGDWSRAAPGYRKKILLRWAELIEENALDLAVLGVRDNGTEIAMAYKAEPLKAAQTIRYYAEAIDKVYGEIAPTAENALGMVLREPVGVVGAIVPWNFPLMIGSWKLGPALAAGNSVVLKPSEEASLTLLRLAELAAQAGMPDGVLNVVTGRGATTGEALALHMDVDAIAFTGSGGVGRALLRAAADSNLKRVFLELGGKSPNIVFADAKDLEKAAQTAAAGIFRNSGQVCVASSRLLVENSIQEVFLKKIIELAEDFKVANPLDLTTRIGAVASERQLQRNLSYVEKASSEGATLATGGKRINKNLGGYYMAPTVFSDVTPSMAIAKEEVFGPILSVLTFEDVAEAVKIANATPYGLSASVWTADLDKAHNMVRSIQSGVVNINCTSGSDITVPMGGVKQSGNGHDKSLHALDKFTNLKTAWFSFD